MEGMKSQQGQAAVTDALYLLLIVTTLAVFLFVFSIRFGSGISNVVSRQYSIDFTSSALKSLLYASVPRDATYYDSPNPSQFPAEFDYLLAIAKQDYFVDRALSDNTKQLIRYNIRGIMKPISSNADFFLYWYTPVDGKTVMGFLYATEFPSGSGFECGSTANSRFFSNEQLLGARRVEYFCDPEDYSAVQSLIQSVGEATQSSAGLRMIQSRGKSDTETIASKIDLISWTATCVPKSVLDQLNCEPVQ